jgi:hypothetical protein
MFNYFQKINYNFGQTGGTLSATNIFSNIQIKIDNSSLVKRIDLLGEERPDQLSRRLYNDFDFFWIPMLLTGVRNPIIDWSKYSSVVYVDSGMAETIRNTLRDSKTKNINIKLSEL